MIRPTFHTYVMVRQAVIILLATILLGLEPCEGLLNRSEWEDWIARGKGQEAPQGYYIVLNNGALKFLNDKVFSGQTLYSEHFSDVVSFLFQHAMRQSLTAQLESAALTAYAPFAKYVELALQVRNGSFARLAPLAEGARLKALEQTEQLFYDNDQATISLLASIAGQQSQLATAGIYTFSGGKRTHLKSLNDEDSKTFRTKLLAAFDRQAFHDFLRENFGIGLGGSVIDGHFAARLSSLKSGRGRQPVIFDLFLMMNVFRGLANQRRELDWLFEPLNEQQLMAAMHAYRAAKDSPNPQTWGAPLRLVIEREATRRGQTLDSLGPELFGNLDRFLKTANLLDYLPPDWVIAPSDTALRFDNLERPNAVFFFDARGLGSMGLIAQATVWENLAAKSQQISELIRTELNKDKMDAQAMARIEQEMLNLQTMRENTLGGVNDYLIKLRHNITGRLASAKLTPADYVLWYSGDDMLLTLRNENGPALEKLAAAIAADEALDGRIRLAFSPVTEQTLSLDQARVGIAKTASALKILEGHFPARRLIVAAESNNSNKLRILEVINQDRVIPLDADTVAQVQAMLPGWQVD